MIKEFIVKHRFALKWIGIAFVIKLVMFIFFAFNFLQNWPANWVTKSFFITTGDTPGYYAPLESFVKGNGYDSFCRMPGLLPFYAPLRLFIDEGSAKAGIVILQLLVQVLSVYALAQIARFIFKSERAFYSTFFIYVFSSFVSIWDHYGMAESFGTSFLIFSIYFLTRFKEEQKWPLLFLSGLFITWSIFFRVIHGLAVPVTILFFLFDRSQLGLSFKRIFLYVVPTAFFLSIWTLKNYTQYHKPVVLTGSVFDCTGFLSKEHIAIRKLIIAWGGDYQPWSKESEAEWFFQTTAKKKNPAPTTHNVYTSKYNLDSLVVLRSRYERMETNSAQLKEADSRYVMEKSALYLESYIKERPLNYYFLNRLLILKKIIIPSRLDDLPFPSLNKMNIFQKLLKASYFLLLIFINVVGLLVCLFELFIRKNKWAIFPLVLIFFLGVVFGYVEQRYLVPVYPFFVIFVANSIGNMYFRFRKKNQLLMKNNLNKKAGRDTSQPAPFSNILFIL
jgi:hypothetical protein